MNGLEYCQSLEQSNDLLSMNEILPPYNNE